MTQLPTQNTDSTLSPRSFLSWRWVAALCSIAALLLAIGALQYRWTTQIRQATEVRMGADLESAMMKWHLDLYGEFSAICVALQIGPDSGARDTWDDYLHRYSEWVNAAGNPQSVENLYTNRDLIENVYIWETSAKSNQRLLRFNAGEGEIARSEIPPNLLPLLGRLRMHSTSLRSALRAWREDAGDSLSGDFGQAVQSAQRLRSTAITGWQFDEQVPAIVHPILHHVQPGSQSADHSSSDPVDWVVVVLNLDTVQKRILPGLTERYFAGAGGLEYKVAVVAAGQDSRVLYTSDPGFGIENVNTSDSVMNIFGPPPESIEGNYWQTVKNSRSVRGEEWRSFSGPVWFPVIQESSAAGPWILVLQHRTGPLEATITKVWRSNLILGGAILLLLAITTVLVVVASQQTQKLANLQMDFVTSVSHELRTPLAAIHSAGQNMIDGFVPNLATYGNLITTQSRQLIDLVDQVLLFAVVRAGKLAYTLQPLTVEQLLEDVRNHTLPIASAAGFKLEFEIPAETVFVSGELKALSRCLQNLVGNAMKYSGQSRWIGVSVEFDRLDKQEVRINVKDRGVGISPTELQQIFRPFYRSPEVVSAQIHGTGLGLSVARQMAESMGGRISVNSKVGTGSTFTLHLPISNGLHPKDAGEAEAITTK
jgi:signal transduction histidine kinase